MISGITIANFRGIERLEVNGFGRVNLIVGKNDSGKTALIEALCVGSEEGYVAGAVALIQRKRALLSLATNFEHFWQIVFRDGDASRGFDIEIRRASGVSTIHLQRPPSGERIDSTGNRMWTLLARVTTPDGRMVERDVARLDAQGTVSFDSLSDSELGSVMGWIGTAVDPDGMLTTFSGIKKRQQEGSVIELLQIVDENIRGVEILAPTGTTAELFVNTRLASTLLPLRVLGDGVQRCLDMAITLAHPSVKVTFIDEFENGIHHSALEPLWRNFARLSKERGAQIFATTHSEECVFAAARAFAALDDDGLRIIRLDRREHDTAAQIYDRTMALAADDLGVDIRG